MVACISCSAPRFPTRRSYLVATLGGSLAAAPAAARARPLRFGLTPVLLNDRMRLLRTWSNQLGTELEQLVEFVQFSAYSQVMDALSAGQLDFAWICGYPYVLHQHQLRLVAVPLWRGKPVYQSYLITDSNSPLSSIDDLRGRTFAYSDPLSNSGFLYVQHLLRQKKINPAQYFGRSFFTYSHRQVVQAVSQGLAVAGAVDGYVWETLAELYPDMTANTRVMLRSPDFGFPPIVAPLDTPAATVHRVAKALQAMSRHPQGQQVLQELRLDGFAPPVRGLYDSIADMARGQKG